MDLQTIFYTLGIIFMSMMIVIMVALIMLLLYMKRKLAAIHDMVSEKVTLLTEAFSHPADTAVTVGAAVAHSAYKKVKKIVEEKQ